MLIDVKVSLRLQLNPEPSMHGKSLEHVIEEAYTG